MSVRPSVPVPQPRMRRGRDRRAELLRAAARVLLRSGTQALTLDAVAREADTSKGGLLYHFPTKAKLQESLLDEEIAHFRGKLDRLTQADPDPHGRHIRAYVRTLVTPGDDCDRPAVLASLMFDPDALPRWRAFSDGWLEPDIEGGDPLQVDAIRALAEGAWLAMALGLRPADERRRRATLQCLLQLILG